jgi:hypothetical protein
LPNPDQCIPETSPSPFLLLPPSPECGPCPLSKHPVIPAHDLVVMRLPFAGLLGSI